MLPLTSSGLVFLGVPATCSELKLSRFVTICPSPKSEYLSLVLDQNIGRFDIRVHYPIFFTQSKCSNHANCNLVCVLPVATICDCTSRSPSWQNSRTRQLTSSPQRNVFKLLCNLTIFGFDFLFWRIERFSFPLKLCDAVPYFLWQP